MHAACHIIKAAYADLESATCVIACSWEEARLLLHVAIMLGYSAGKHAWI